MTRCGTLAATLLLVAPQVGSGEESPPSTAPILRATGIGRPPEKHAGTPVGQRMAERAAQVEALRNLALAAGAYFDLEEGDEKTRVVEAFLAGYSVVRSTVLDGGTVQVEVALPLERVTANFREAHALAARAGADLEALRRENQKLREEIARERARDEDSAAIHLSLAEIEGSWPALPANLPAMREWLSGAERLLARRPIHEARVTELEAAGDPAGAVATALEETREILRGLERIETSMATVREKVGRAERIARVVQAHEADWLRAITEIRGNPAYDGLEMPIQSDLVPIGPDPGSGLQEFWHVPSGSRPERGPDGPIRPSAETGIVLVLVPGGRFEMGSDASTNANEKPAQSVTIPASFVSKYEMTQGQWHLAANADPSRPQEDDLRPVEQVSWEESIRLLRELGMFLPSEAQWEYAARGGTSTEWWPGDDAEALGMGVGNLADQTAVRMGAPSGEVWDDGRGPPGSVGAYRPNAFGLHDTIGNVAEWCRDDYHDSYVGAPSDGSAWEDTPPRSERVFRGASCLDPAAAARSAARSSAAPSLRSPAIGVRPARPIVK